jgi:RNA polymerase sigma factor (sigma-70 family)
MPATALSEAVARLCRPTRAAVPACDRRLLARFARHRDESAFALLVRRHGPMVLGVCRRVLGQQADAEDALQATFLLLARKASAVTWGRSAAPWLYAAAYRIALKARAARCRHRPEPLADEPAAPAADPLAPLAWEEVRRALDEELARLPERLRSPLVLCYLQAHTRDEAAAQLGWSLATLKRRLERGRALLRDRLTRRGFALAAGWGVALTGPSVSAACAADTARAALAYLADGVAPAPLAGLLAGAGPVASRPRAVLALMAVALCAGAAAWAVQRPADLPTAAAAVLPATPTDATGDPLPPGAIARLGTTRLRPGNDIHALAFSPDGRRLASWTGGIRSMETGLTISDTATGRDLRRVMGRWGFKTWAWLPDGRGVAVLDLGPLGHFVWDFADEKAERPPEPPRSEGLSFSRPVEGGDIEDDQCYTISPDGRYLAVGLAGRNDREHSISLRELATGRKPKDLKEARRLSPQPGNCEVVAFTPDGRSLVVLSPVMKGDQRSDEITAVVWDVATGRELRRFTAPRPAQQGERRAFAVANGMLALGLEDEAGSTWLADLVTGQTRTLPTGHRSQRPLNGYGTFAVAFSPDGRTLTTAGRDGPVRLWDVATGRALRSMGRHRSWVEALAVSPDGSRVASGGQDELIRLWDTGTGADACPQPGHDYRVSSVSLSADGRTAVTASNDGLRVWEAATGRERRHIPVTAGGDSIRRAELAPDGRTVLAAVGERLRQWDVATGREEQPPGGLAGSKVGHFRLSGDGRSLATTSGATVTVWDWPAGRPRQTVTLPAPEKSPGDTVCGDVALSPDGRLLVTTSYLSWFREERGLHLTFRGDGVADLWDVATGRRLRRLATAIGNFRTALFTPDGGLLLTGSGQIPAADGSTVQPLEGGLHLLDPLTGRLRRSFAHPAGFGRPEVLALRLAPDGRSVSVAGVDGAVTVYETATGQMRRRLTGHRGTVFDLALSADGKRLLTGGSDLTALVWDISATTAAPRPDSPPSTEELAQLWDGLADAEAGPAFRALAALAAVPEAAVALARDRLRPVESPDDATLDRLVADLNSDRYAVRQKAEAELDRLAPAAVAGLRARLAGSPTLEVRGRLTRLLARHDPDTPTPERLRELRALELLEQVGTAEARSVLADLTRGGPTARRTLEAAAALHRLERPAAP